MSAYIKNLQAIVAAQLADAAAGGPPALAQRIEAIIGDATTTRIQDLVRAVQADARAIGTVLRALGFRRERIWSGDDYALTRWKRTSATVSRTQ